MNTIRGSKLAALVIGALIGVAIFAAPVALAQSLVECRQGDPGRKGAWPVKGPGANGALTVTLSNAPSASITVAAEFCATNVAGGTAAAAFPAGTKWFELINLGPSNCACVYGGAVPVIGSRGEPFAGKGANVYDVADRGSGWLPATVASSVPTCICAAAQVTPACFQILTLQ